MFFYISCFTSVICALTYIRENENNLVHNEYGSGFLIEICCPITLTCSEVIQICDQNSSA
jgi:hypothetical protein